MTDDPRKPPAGRPPPQRTMIAPLPGSVRRPQAEPPAQSGVWAFPAAPGTPPVGAPPDTRLPPGQRVQPMPDPFGLGDPVRSADAPGFGQQPEAPQPAVRPGAWMGASSPEHFFPEIARPDQGARVEAPIPRIPLERALDGLGMGQAGAENPLLGAASGLLILFGRLRSRVVDMAAMPLLTHVTHQIDGFEPRAIEAGADPADAQVAKYVLCGTADDIVQNLPGTDGEAWVQFAMVPRFFHRRTSGVDVFRQIDAALADPARRYHLLELMLVCLQLGFEGQYRSAPGGDVELQRWRRRIHETLRRIRPREDDDISPRWQGVAAPTRFQRRQIPLWVIVGVGLAVLGGSYLAVRVHLSDLAVAVAGDLRALHPETQLALVRTSLPEERAVETRDAAPLVPAVPVFAPPDKLTRIRAALADDITAGRLTVGERGAFIVVSANNALMNFAIGSAEIRSDIAPVAARIGQALAREQGTIEVVGHTDNIPMSGRGRFRSNEALSLARAEAVAAVLRAALGSGAALQVTGAGEDDPIASNATEVGRAQNRRVEIRIRLSGE